MRLEIKVNPRPTKSARLAMLKGLSLVKAGPLKLFSFRSHRLKAARIFGCAITVLLSCATVNAQESSSLAPGPAAGTQASSIGNIGIGAIAVVGGASVVAMAGLMRGSDSGAATIADPESGSNGATGNGPANDSSGAGASGGFFVGNGRSGTNGGPLPAGGVAGSQAGSIQVGSGNSVGSVFVIVTINGFFTIATGTSTLGTTSSTGTSVP